MNLNTRNARRKIKKAWLEALKSGEYEQGHGRLNFGLRSCCCLGVLCDVLHKNFGEGEWQWSEETGYEFVYYHGDGYELVARLRDELDISRELQNKLIHMNDYECKSFEEIAPHIKKEWKVN